MSPARAGSLVIFDCDGVLVDSEVVAARVLARELAAIGFPLNAEECIARYTGISMLSVIERVVFGLTTRMRMSLTPGPVGLALAAARRARARP